MHTPQEQDKHVINEEGRKLVKLAREFGINGRELKAFVENKEKREKIFSEIKEGASWITKLEENAKKIGARIYVIHNLRVDYTRPHNDTSLSNGPQSLSDQHVFKMEDLYKTENSVIMETVILFNFPKGEGSCDRAVEWGLSNSLRRTTPHCVFAIGENYPKLNNELGSNPICVLETTGCFFGGGQQVCFLSGDGTVRKRGLYWRSFFGCSGDWFAFRR